MNEQIKDLPVRPPAVYEAFICECYRDRCTDFINLTMEEYEGIRAHPARFAVLPRHVNWEVERVVDSADGRYEVAEKIELAGEVAARMDPRS
jgi:hypothetical protein